MALEKVLKCLARVTYSKARILRPSSSCVFSRHTPIHSHTRPIVLPWSSYGSLPLYTNYRQVNPYNSYSTYNPDEPNNEPYVLEGDISKPPVLREKVRVFDNSRVSHGVMSLLEAERLANTVSKELNAKGKGSVKVVVTDKLDDEGYPIARLLPKKPDRKTHTAVISLRIGSADLQVKLNQVQKWLIKGDVVHITFKDKRRKEDNLKSFRSNIVRLLEKNVPQAQFRDIAVGTDKDVLQVKTDSSKHSS